MSEQKRSLLAFLPPREVIILDGSDSSDDGANELSTAEASAKGLSRSRIESAESSFMNGTPLDSKRMKEEDGGHDNFIRGKKLEHGLIVEVKVHSSTSQEEQSEVQEEQSEVQEAIESMKKRRLEINMAEFKKEYPGLVSKYNSKSLISILNSHRTGRKKINVDEDEEGEKDVQAALLDMKMKGIPIDKEHLRQHHPEIHSKYDGRSLVFRIQRFNKVFNKECNKRKSVSQQMKDRKRRKCTVKKLSEDKAGRTKVIKALRELGKKKETTLSNFKAEYPELCAKYTASSIAKTVSFEIKKMREMSSHQSSGRIARNVGPPIRYTDEHPQSDHPQTLLPSEDNKCYETEEESNGQGNVENRNMHKVDETKDRLAEILMRDVMKLNLEDRTPDIVATFITYSNKFNEEGFNTPLILKTLKDEPDIDEYLVAKISLKKGHLLMFKKWLITES